MMDHTISFTYVQVRYSIDYKLYELIKKYLDLLAILAASENLLKNLTISRFFETTITTSIHHDLHQTRGVYGASALLMTTHDYHGCLWVLMNSQVPYKTSAPGTAVALVNIS